MKKLTLFLLLIGFSLSQAQTVEFHWAGSIIPAGDQNGRSIEMDQQGNTYIAGNFYDTLDADLGPGSVFLTSGLNAGYIIKVNPKGALVWAAQIRHKNTNNNGYSSVNDIKIDSLGNVYAVGHFSESWDFDPGPGVHYKTHPRLASYVWKLDKYGNLDWVLTHGNTTDNHTHWQIEILENGNIVIPTRFRGILDVDPSPTSTVNIDFGSNGKYAILELTSSGSFVSVDTLSQSLSQSYPGKVMVGKNHDYYLTGQFEGTQDFDPSINVDNHTAIGGDDIFLTKLNANFQYQWTKTIGGLGEQHVKDIKLDSLDNIYLAGGFESTTDFDPGPAVVNKAAFLKEDAFIAKYDSAGNYIWVQNFGNHRENFVDFIAIGKSGSVFGGGSFASYLDFDPGSGIDNRFAQSSNSYVVQYTNFGQFEWVQTFESRLGYPINIAAGPFDNVCLFGYFEDSVNANPTITGPLHYATSSSSESGLFVTSFSNCSTTAPVIDVIDACNAHTWIDGVTYTQNNSSASIILENRAGCDSVVNLFLTVDYTDTSIAVNNMTVVANQAGAKYQWIRCDWNNFVLTNDTNQTFVANQSGYYAVVINDNGCIDTSRCVALGDISIPSFEQTKVIIYPNPSTGIITVEHEQTDNPKLKIYSTTGKLVYQTKLISSKSQLQLSLSSGVYIVELNSEGISRRQRLVIQH